MCRERLRLDHLRALVTGDAQGIELACGQAHGEARSVRRDCGSRLR